MVVEGGNSSAARAMVDVGDVEASGVFSGNRLNKSSSTSIGVPLSLSPGVVFVRLIGTLRSVFVDELNEDRRGLVRRGVLLLAMGRVGVDDAAAEEVLDDRRSCRKGEGSIVDSVPFFGVGW